MLAGHCKNALLKIPFWKLHPPPLIGFLHVECSETGNASVRSLQFLVSGTVSVPSPPGDIQLSHEGTAGSEISFAPNVEMKWACEGILGLLYKEQNARWLGSPHLPWVLVTFLSCAGGFQGQCTLGDLGSSTSSPTSSGILQSHTVEFWVAP